MDMLEKTLDIAKKGDTKMAKQLQLDLHKKISLKDSLGFLPNKIMGVDLAYKDDNAFVSIVLWNNLTRKVETVFNAHKKVVFPYIPGFLSFREFPVFYKLYVKTGIVPDLIIFDGHGYAHPRKMGLATHAGILLNIPTIGCAKSKLVGTYNIPSNYENSHTELFYRGELIGYVLRTRINVKPIFVSPGSNISFETSLKIIMNLARKTKLPQIMQTAHNSCEKYKRDTLL